MFSFESRICQFHYCPAVNWRIDMQKHNCIKSYHHFVRASYTGMINVMRVFINHTKPEIQIVFWNSLMDRGGNLDRFTHLLAHSADRCMQKFLIDFCLQVVNWRGNQTVHDEIYVFWNKWTNHMAKHTVILNFICWKLICPPIFETINISLFQEF